MSKSILNTNIYLVDDEEEELRKKWISFGTTQFRTCFPHAVMPTKLGRKMCPIRGQPNLGPGAYKNDEFNTVVGNCENWITTKRGYTHVSRTGPRILKEFSEVTPCPTNYQRDQSRPRTFVQASEPFNSKEKRMKYKLKQPDLNPGPGIYDLDLKQNRRVRWPQQFGKPIFPIAPNLPKRSVRTELMVDKEYRKFKNKVAYFRLYY